MYIIALDDTFFLKSIGQTDSEGDTPMQATMSQSEAMQFEARWEADDINTRFGLNGEIRDVV